MRDSAENRLKARRGEDCPQHVLTAQQVKLIRQQIALRNEYYAKARALSNKRLAEQFGVHWRTIDRISAMETWIHVGT